MIHVVIGLPGAGKSTLVASVKAWASQYCHHPIIRQQSDAYKATPARAVVAYEFPDLSLAIIGRYGDLQKSSCGVDYMKMSVVKALIIRLSQRYNSIVIEGGANVLSEQVIRFMREMQTTRIYHLDVSARVREQRIRERNRTSQHVKSPEVIGEMTARIEDIKELHGDLFSDDFNHYTAIIQQIRRDQ